MHVLVTGATGTIGSAVVTALIAHGHEVTAPVRSQEKADRVSATGAHGVVADLTDTAALADLLRAADAAIHTAASTDDAEGFDRGVAEAVVGAFAGTGKPYVHTGGCWVYGAGEGITETDPYDPPALTAWRPGVEALLADADVVLSVVHPGIVYGAPGLQDVLVDAPRDEDGRFTTVGSGEQHWTTVHVDDLADLYVLVLEAGSGLGAVIGVNGDAPRVKELSAAAAGPAGVATEDEQATRERFGDAFAGALLLDQQLSNAKARGLGWNPERSSLLSTLGA